MVWLTLHIRGVREGEVEEEVEDQEVRRRSENTGKEICKRLIWWCTVTA